jgi:FixJ family two-component response regulator
MKSTRRCKAGNVQFLQKPVNKDALLLSIRNAVNSPRLGWKKRYK